MNIPNFENATFIDRSGYLTDYWAQILQQLFSELQKNVGQEGFIISPVSSASDSVTPPAAGGQIAVLEAAYAASIVTPFPAGPLPGTIIFDPAEVNGGSAPAPRGQLKVLLNDGIFHAITNT